jgi:hypothetical protein
MFAGSMSFDSGVKFDFAADASSGAGDAERDAAINLRWHRYSWPSVPPGCRPATELQARAESANFLLGMQRKLARVQPEAPGMPPRGLVRMRVDDRMSAELTRVRKSAMHPATFDRTGTEAYPLPAPVVVDMTPGMNTRWWKRGSEVRGSAAM